MAVQPQAIAHSEFFKLLLTLFLSFLIGLEREEKRVAGQYTFGGVRTYPLIGLVGYAMALLSKGHPLLLAIGLVVIGGLMMLSYWHKIRSSQDPGLTSEIAGLMTYLVGALVHQDYFWLASTVVVLSLILLELKAFLEGLARRFSAEDIFTFTQFLFLTLVILPVLPNQALGPFQLNPFKTWLVVIAVSGISYASFLLQKVLKGQQGVVLIALLGGAYSSTVTTVALAKQSSQDPTCPHNYSGAILMASGMMYLRLAILVSLFNPTLGQQLAIAFVGLAIAAISGGWLWAQRARRIPTCVQNRDTYTTGNPLELRAAFVFAALFVAIVIGTHYTIVYWGQGGIYILATILGITDVDPFIMGMTQAAGQSTPLSVAGIAIAIAASSNNLVKGGYALAFGDRTSGRQSVLLLTILAGLGLMPLLWLL